MEELNSLKLLEILEVYSKNKLQEHQKVNLMIKNLVQPVYMTINVLSLSKMVEDVLEIHQELII